MTNIINKNRLLVGQFSNLSISRSLALGLVALVVFSCGREEKLDPEIEKLGRATGPVEPGAQALANRPIQERAPSKVHRGKVLETMDASRYTYLKVDTGSAQIWAAVPMVKVEVGQTVEVAESLQMQDFSSPTLGRKFDLIIFGTLGGQLFDGGVPEMGMPPGMPKAMPPGMPQGMPQGMPPGHPPVEMVKPVEKK